ncbi:hypothetical protein GCM10027446_12200 [Angustibacter peucedani]
MSAPTGPAVVHRELLLPSPAVWVVCGLVAASLGLTVLGALGAVVALGVSLVAVAAVVAALLASSARLEVADGELRAGRAHIPVALLGRVRVLDAARTKALRGPEADARAYLCTRGWIHEAVLVEVVDPQDPTPYWLLSSREPARLAAAITAAGAGTARDEPSQGSGGAGEAGQEHSRQTG